METTQTHTKGQLLHHQQRGYLHYWNGTEVVEKSGWFWLSLDRRTVIRRKIGGRNCYAFAMTENALGFYPDKNAR